jgi:hypothetical protein
LRGITIEATSFESSGLNKPFPAYTGTEPYVFVCYAHSDSEKVYADLPQLGDGGIRIWYDEGIQAGAAWRGEIASAIKGASKFLFFISAASLDSTHCLREVDYALNNDIEILPVYLDDSTLPGELELVLNRVQALFRESDSTYIEHLVAALQAHGQHAPLRQLTKRGALRSWLPVLVFVTGLLLLFLWTQWGSLTRGQISRSIASPSAYNGYLEGLELMERWDKEGNLDAAIGLFREATALDSSFALAYARLAEALRIRYALFWRRQMADRGSGEGE